MRQRRHLIGIAVAVIPALLVSGCSGNGDTPNTSETVRPKISTPAESSSPVPPEAVVGPDAAITVISARQWDRMVSAGVWRQGCPVGRRDLRRVEINHHTFDGEIQRGALVVNKDIARSVVRIFTRLFEAEFPIRKMRPVEAYLGDVKDSLRDDNTSAYNCRRPSQINAPTAESPHANGRAIDINPVENPWKDLRCKCWVPNRENRFREPGPGVIVKGGVVWKAFRDEGWIWQDIDVPDYMHFDTGYPSRPYKGPTKASS